MSPLFLSGLACAVAPWLLSWLHPLLGSLTRPLVYLLAAAQALIVPVLVAVDENISFGGDTYSLGAGVAIMLITAVEFVFLIGTGVGLLLAVGYINRRERVADIARVAALCLDVPSSDAPAAMPHHNVSEMAAAATAKPFGSFRPDTLSSDDPPLETRIAPRRSIGLSLLGAYLCFVLAVAGGGVLMEGLTTGSFGWVRNFGAVTFADRPIAFVMVAIMYATPTIAAVWGVVILSAGVWRRWRRSASDFESHNSGHGQLPRK